MAPQNRSHMSQLSDTANKVMKPEKTVNTARRAIAACLHSPVTQQLQHLLVIVLRPGHSLVYHTHVVEE